MQDPISNKERDQPLEEHQKLTKNFNMVRHSEIKPDKIASETNGQIPNKTAKKEVLNILRAEENWAVSLRQPISSTNILRKQKAKNKQAPKLDRTITKAGSQKVTFHSFK